MLENIKMLLGIDNDSKDILINYWIDYYTKMVLKYCHLIYLEVDLQSIVEQMVVARLGALALGKNTGVEEKTPDGVRSITRGDYSITYKGDSESSKISTLDYIAVNFQGQLNLYRRLDY